MSLLNIIKNFIEQKETDFAILINGKWGSGKTFFLKNEVKNMVSHINCKISDKVSKPFEIAYVSLYGITTADELQKHLFLEVNPILKTKAGRITSSLLSKGLQFIGVENSDKDQKELLNIFGGIPKNKVLVFDDLERLETETLNEVLGFINTYTEHQKLKVIIIADEEKIQEKLNDYSIVKEKLIRFSYLYDPNIIDIFPNFISRFDNEIYKMFLTERQDKICSLFEKGDHNNLRSLRFVLDLFEKVFEKLTSEKDIQDSCRNTILDRLLYFFISYSIALKKGTTRNELESLKALSSEIDSPINISIFDLLEETGEEDTPQATEVMEQFKEKFEKTFITETNNEFEFFQFLATYIHTGELSTDELISVGLKIQQKIVDKTQKPEQIALEKLNHCLQLDDDQYLPLIEEILDYVKKGIYRLDVYPGIFLQILTAAHNEVENIKVDNDMVMLFKEGMHKSLSISEYKEGFNRPTLMSKIKGYDLLKDITEYASSLNESLLEKKDALIANKVMELLRSEKLSELSDYMLNEEVQSNPVFQVQFIPPEEFFNIFIALSNRKKMDLLGMLEQFSRRFINYASELKPEIDFFSKLLKLVKDEIEKAKGHHRLSTEILVSLKLYLDKTIAQLK